MSNNLIASYPADFLSLWEGCAHLDCLPQCRHGLETGHCERLERAFGEYQKKEAQYAAAARRH